MIFVMMVFVFLLLIGTPVAITLAFTSVFHIIVMGEPKLFEMLPQRLFTAADSFSLLAIPLFVMAGEIMGFGGITQVLADFGRSLIGHVRGGLAYATTIVGMFLGALLGSANAEAALLGSVIYPELRRDNYEPEFSTCLCASVAILGPIIPPSLVLIVYGVVARVSISELFFSGIIPGLMLALIFGLTIFLHGQKAQWKVNKWVGPRETLRSALRALPALLVPATILGGILGGVMTPTESAGIAVAIALILAFFVYKKLQIKDIPKILSRSASITGIVMLLTVAANSLAWTLALDNIPELITSSILSFVREPWILMLLINIILLIIGCVLEPIAGIIIFVPVLLPIATAIGVDPIHFGIIVCINLVIGMITPPVCEVLVTTCMITKVPFSKCIIPIWKWVFGAVIVLLLITYIPSLALTVPRMLFGN